MKYITLIIVLIILTACKSDKHIYDYNNLENIQKLKINKALNFEKIQDIVDANPDYNVGIGKGIYPNKNNFELQSTISFKRKINGKFELETRYYYSKKDSIIRVILYQWHNPKNNKLTENKTKNKKKFEKKFKSIEKKITKILGQPNIVDLNKDHFPNTRDERKWLNSNNVKAYLYKSNFAPLDSYLIELAIYAE